MSPFELELTIDLKGYEEHLKTIDTLNHNMNNLQKPMRKIGDYFIKKVKQGFSTGTDPYGDDWEVITQMALLSRQVNTNDATPLTDTGVMKNSNSVKVSKDGLKLSNTSDNSYVHQLGIGRVPVRLIFPIENKGLPAEWENYAIDTITKHLTGNL